ncbi:MAG: 1-(5-phosphoribosyl)-5-[(5-phosphoribosylamino)methylideneamino]imidazole-4-carboxamide isomerase [Alphaproteobacteria bacterium]|nr:1-(5-phosphoribosyl)-5-[(5-phosphoribosylamino)methylideneamino]imidazole-4-carboxamide isomerase [Alphaproteobacteria bacterium]
MILYPAIDLKDGQCVRLRRGDMAQATVFNADPVAQARTFEGLGFSWLHVVDLDGAFAGRPMNAVAVEAIAASIKMPIQLGGGIRDLATIERWLARGVARVILGTVAVRDPALVREAARRFSGKVAVGIDARDGKVAVQGWAEQSALGALDLARSLEDAGIAAIIHTDIGRDGVLEGVNVAAMAAMAQAVRIPVIASGGVATIDDVRLLREAPGRAIAGAVIGRALYDGGLDARAALKAAA